MNNAKRERKRVKGTLAAMLAMKSKAAGALVACLASLAATASSSSSSSSTVEGQQAYDFTNSQNYSSEAWSYIGGGSIEPSEEGLVLSLDKQGDYPTLVSVDTLLYGTFETVLKTASGKRQRARASLTGQDRALSPQQCSCRTRRTRSTGSGSGARRTRYRLTFTPRAKSARVQITGAKARQTPQTRRPRSTRTRPRGTNP